MSRMYADKIGGVFMKNNHKYFSDFVYEIADEVQKLKNLSAVFSAVQVLGVIFFVLKVFHRQNE